MKKISRRDFLKVTGLVGAAAALTACGGSASSTAASTASSAAGSAAASTAALGADTQAIVDRGVLKVGVKNAVKGFSFQDTLTGEYKGLEDSLAEMIAEHLGVDVEFTTVTAATRGELLDSGDIDAVLATFTITEERKKTWDFSTPYYTDYVSVLVEDSTGIKGLADLKDKVVGRLLRLHLRSCSGQGHDRRGRAGRRKLRRRHLQRRHLEGWHLLPSVRRLSRHQHRTERRRSAGLLRR